MSFSMKFEQRSSHLILQQHVEETPQAKLHVRQYGRKLKNENVLPSLEEAFY